MVAIGGWQLVIGGERGGGRKGGGADTTKNKNPTRQCGEKPLERRKAKKKRRKRSGTKAGGLGRECGSTETSLNSDLTSLKKRPNAQKNGKRQRGPGARMEVIEKHKAKHLKSQNRRSLDLKLT